MNNNCFICGKAVKAKNCPICYECAQAYKKAVVQYLEDTKDNKEVKDIARIALGINDIKYQNIVRNYLLNNNYRKIENSKIQKAIIYMTDNNRANSIINELYAKGIIMINDDGNIVKTPSEMIEQQANINISIIRNQEKENLKKEFSKLQVTKETITDTEKNLGMFTNKFRR